MTTTPIEENERLAREHFDRVWNHGEFETDALADEYRVQTNLGTQEEHSLETFQEFVAQAREAVPDLRKEIDDSIATDGKVTIRYTMTGTQKGEFKGIPPTGESIEITGVGMLLRWLNRSDDESILVFSKSVLTISRYPLRRWVETRWLTSIHPLFYSCVTRLVYV